MLGHYTTAPDFVVCWRERLFSLASVILPDRLRFVKPSGCQFWHLSRFFEKSSGVLSLSGWQTDRQTDRMLEGAYNRGDEARR